MKAPVLANARAAIGKITAGADDAQRPMQTVRFCAEILGFCLVDFLVARAYCLLKLGSRAMVYLARELCWLSL